MAPSASSNLPPGRESRNIYKRLNNVRTCVPRTCIFILLFDEIWVKRNTELCLLNKHKLSITDYNSYGRIMHKVLQKSKRRLKTLRGQKDVIYFSVSQPPGRGPVPGPGISYTGPREVLLELITNLNVILYLSTCHTVHIIAPILFMITP